MSLPLRSALWPLAAPALGVVTVLLYMAGGGGAFRILITLVFLGVGPGLALVRLLGLVDSIAILTLALALSLAIDTIISGVLAYSGHWSPAAGVVTVLVIVFAAAALELSQRMKRESAP